jgi:hypothetical protein
MSSDKTRRVLMARLIVLLALGTLALAGSTPAQQPPGPAATPADYILLTVIMKHDQSKNLDEITKLLDDAGFWAKFPPDGIAVESWYIAMGLGHIVTLRVPPARLREVNRAVEQTAWKAFRTEFHPTYDAREIVKTLRERALKK